MNHQEALAKARDFLSKEISLEPCNISLCLSFTVDKTMTIKTNLHQKVTEHIIEAIKNTKDFEMPWHNASGLPINALTRNPYIKIYLSEI